ncbi:MAG: GTPase ObgE [Clostridia bacterium]|nr:GTPase ObgE [Clostridia bacterium]
MFIDSARIYLKAGNGGNGAVSFHREKYVAAGGPDGGDGGRGGDIVFIVDQGIRTLADFRYKKHYKADPGQDGGSANCSGKGAEDLVIKVPAGTIVKEEETGHILADLTEVGQTAIIAKGGKGGAGNQHFATATRQVPNFAKSGTPGEERWVVLELKLLADVGLIGFPNVGKSTILSMISAAKPKIANYHFTTIEPNLGVVSLEEGNSFVVADIPGLIEGAHEGIGLGHEFLKHVERTKLLVHVVDVSGIEGRDPVEDFEVINKELREYNPVLASRPQVVAANKTDIPDSEENYKEFAEKIEAMGYKVFPVSAATNKGLRELLFHVSDQLKVLPETILVSETDQEVVYTAEEEKSFEIRRENEIYVVEGPWARRIVSNTNFGDYESLQYFQRAMRKKGVIDALEKMGVSEGDTVRVHDFEFEYVR